MIPQTQTHSDNCWQTAVASVLQVPAALLPDQHLIEGYAKTNTPHAGHYSYSNALNAYLAKHHGLAYLQDPAWKMLPFLLRGPGFGFHFLIGPTVRTVVDGSKPRIHHVVVAEDGTQVWDPHPSQAGLTRITSVGWLADITKIDPEDSALGHGWHWANKDAYQRDLRGWQQRHEHEGPHSLSALCCCLACFVDGEYVSGE